MLEESQIPGEGTHDKPLQPVSPKAAEPFNRPDLFADLFSTGTAPGPGKAPPSEAVRTEGPASEQGTTAPQQPHQTDPAVPTVRKPPTVREQSTDRDHRTDSFRTPHVRPPRCPSSLKESGLSIATICDLILKQLYLQGSLLGLELARNACLSFSVIDEPLRFLKDEKCIEVASGDVIGRVSYRFQLTDLGRIRARESFEQCRYVGPAPVMLEDYVRQCRDQAVAGSSCTQEALLESFKELIINDGLLDELGPAVCSGRSIFIYGPPGNGKSAIAKGLGNFLNHRGGEIYVPYAIHTENSIVTVFDPTVHQTTDDAELARRNKTQPTAIGDDATTMLTDAGFDPRWRRIRRPVVMTGGELTLEMLELRYNKVSNFYAAPPHIKANGGVFLIDDFGRQIVSPRDLLNRWILPLEERIDYLTLATGKKFSVPFEQLIIFSTNLDPRELVDEAFLRRIRHKIKITAPDRETYTEIFKLCCRGKDFDYRPDAVEYLFANCYGPSKFPRSSDPRDLLEIIQAICRFRNQPPVLTEELVAEAARRFFCKVA